MTKVSRKARSANLFPYAKPARLLEQDDLYEISGMCDLMQIIEVQTSLLPRTVVHQGLPYVRSMKVVFFIYVRV